MKRFLLFIVLVPSLGCAVPADRMPLPALPENALPMPYAELLTRLRAQARSANDSFYLDRWGEVEDFAKGIEQTARFLAKATDVPAKNKDILNEVTGDLAKNALKLRDAAVAKNEDATIAALKLIRRNLQQLRLGD
jgi:hypothetical protein